MMPDAQTSEIFNEIRTDGNVFSVVAFQRDDGRVVVFTGDLDDGMILMRVADFGELIGHLQALRKFVYDGATAVNGWKGAGRVRWP
jgi:hypothetical protein